MADTDLVSVIIPVYNGEAYLSEAIKSVLNQSYEPIEVIVVDDGSTDGSAEVAASFGSSLRYAHQPNQGLGAALNRGIELATGHLFAFLDADDLWCRDKLRMQSAVLDENPDVEAVFGLVQAFHSPDLDEETRKRFHCPPDPMPGYCKSAILIKREAFFRVGLFATVWQMGDFLEWYARAKEEGLHSAMVPQVVLRRRVHGANTSSREASQQKQYAQILKAALDRRRKKGSPNSDDGPSATQ